ncbi:type II secretion system secretin GspD [Delftia tsuruhatensis]|uniref:type II secretion system secretin GspD n=1 Tax=Delftia tsuruhatensis TaxID=180282 RepID=UPI00244731D3|nr:type II secretion system secretin GspD [Delftia tsuruhatensis]MDH1456286.1 type II secretion system secretin GspD [Delftia tsuruhatensis]
MKEIGQKIMKFHYRPVQTVLAVAVCQLLLACAQPAQKSFVSHFGTGHTQEYFFTEPEEEKKSDSKADEGRQPRIMEGTGRLIGEPKALPPVSGAPVKLSFEDAPLAQVVRTVLGDILSLDYVLHPPIAGTVTLSTQKEVPADQALNLLETALQANGMAMVRDARGTYHVGRVDALKSIGATVRQAVVDKPLAPGYGTIIVPLQYIGANEMASILRPMVPGDAIVRVDNVRNLLVMVGSRAQAEGWLEMVRTFDVNLLEGMSVGVFPLKYVTIQEVNAALQLMSGGGATAQAAAPAAGAAGTAGAARPGGAAAAAAPNAATALGEGNPLFGALRIMPIERLNSILVITPRAAYLEEARRWIAKLDQPGSGGAQPQLNIYHVQNGNAKHLAGVLSGIFGGPGGGSSTNSGVAPGLGTSMGNSGFGNSGFGNSGFGSSGLGNSGFGNNQQRLGQTGVGGQGGGTASIGNIRVMADELNNSVLVWGTPAEFERIEVTLKKLDLPPTQVLIEASIVEVTLNDGLQFGLQWSFNGGLHNSNADGTGTLRTADSTTSDLGEALGMGFNYTVRSSASRVRATLNALSTKTNVKVVASPSLMVLDNHTAAIAVGTQQPYRSGETSTSATVGTTTTNSYQYKDTGVNLQVTPSVNAGNLVTMTVNQQVIDVGSEDKITKQTAFLQRQLSSRVSVRSGESIVMGGLIQETNTNSRNGVPFLHDLPVVGNLFGSTSNSGRRTELLVIITPRVVRSDVDIRSVSDDLRDQMRALVPLLKTPEPAGSKAEVEIGPLSSSSVR